MYHCRFKNSHYSAGYQYGALLNKFNKKLCKCPTFIIDEARIKFAKSCEVEYEKYYPEILQEIRGIADGNETSYEFLISMLLTMYCYDVNNKCSCFAIKDNENILFGRNSDFLVSIEKLYMNVIYSLNGVYSFTGNTTAFVEIEDGINEFGLAIGLTFIASNYVKPGFNAGMIVRYLLEKCSSVDECIEKIKRLPIASAQTITIADTSGNIVVIECSAKDINIISDNRCVYATNVFKSLTMQKYNLESFDNWKAEERYNTLERTLNGNHKYSVVFAQNLLAGKYGFICQYDRKKNADTVWSVVYDLKSKKIYRVEGNPFRKKYIEDTRFKFQSKK